MTYPSRRRRMLVLTLGLLIAAGVAAQTPQPGPKSAKPAASAKKKASEPAYKMVLEPKAMDLLKATSARLAAAKSMTFTATVGYEFPSKLGPPIVYTTRYDVTMQRPDKLKVMMPGDGPASEVYYDGKYPFTDLIVPDPYAALTDGAKLAFYIGASGVVGGVNTDMVAWANDDVFLQIWIGVDDKLPHRIRAIHVADPLQLRHEMERLNWQLDPPLAADAFAS